MQEDYSVEKWVSGMVIVLTMLAIGGVAYGKTHMPTKTPKPVESCVVVKTII